MTPSPYQELAAALGAITSRVRTDITAVKRADGVQAWTKEALTPDRLQRHLNGGPARGVCPIKAGESVTMVGLLDFDSHGGETPWSEMASVAALVVETLEFMGGAPIAFRSSGGRGIHVYVLWDDPQDAYSVRQWLGQALALSGLRPGVKGVAHGQVEVFPKQDSVPADGNGSQFILPLAGASVPLVLCEFAGVLVEAPAGRSAVLGMDWPASYPVPVAARPTRPAPVAAGAGAGLSDELLAALAVLNAGGRDLDYDEWRNMVFALHHETGGSEEGRALAHEVSARSIKYDPAFLDERVWPYVRSGDDRTGAAITGRTIVAMARARGWVEPIPSGAFDVEADAGVGGVGAVGAAGVGAGGGGPGASVEGVVRGGIPEAQHLTTDQANAVRLVDSFGTRVLVAAGRWYSWTGTHWAPDEADVYRMGCRLSDLIHGEARRIRAKAREGAAALDLAAVARADDIADALDKWAARSEMKATIENALGLVKKMLSVDAGILDRDPWAFNCLNGTIDLRTGALRPHAAGDYITKICRLAYDPAAQAPTWTRALAQITMEDGRPEGSGKRVVAEFLERWFGYCMTGLTREQCFVVHWGAGANGKSTVLDTVAEVLGDYAGTAAPGLLLASRGDRHPTELAHLHGLRMVTSHESGDAAVLREDMIKQATGGDKITARRMREDFFEFDPTHKLQLLTNHKPVVRGTDHGIWRRVLLVPYEARFGVRAEVEAGQATHERDVGMVDALRAEKAGILARLVQAAVSWGVGGLQAPDRVLLASKDYKQEQDRAAQFVSEVCEVGEGLREPLTLGMGGLYPEYVTWCKDGGMQPLSSKRFLGEVLRVIPGSSVETGKTVGEGGKRRSVVWVRGLKILPE